MKPLFVTGADAAFFPTLLVLLQSFAERLPGQSIYVCDYGLGPAQRDFLRRHGMLLERPPGLALAADPFRNKTALYRYVQHAPFDPTNFTALVWLDADLTLIGCSIDDFEAIVTRMAAHNIDIAACPDKSIAEQVKSFRRRNLRSAPFEQILADSRIDTALPYYSTGLFFCRSSLFLEHWAEIAAATEYHVVLDQNIFNVVLHRAASHVLPLDLDTWQAQGDTLDRIEVQPGEANRGPAAFLDGKPVKALHATSHTARHLFMGAATFRVQDVMLAGHFKLILREQLLRLQLPLLRRFLTAHGSELVELGICRRLPGSPTGVEFKAVETPA